MPPDEAAAAPAKKPAALANSMWCIDPDGKLGMIAEINSGTAMFYHEKADHSAIESEPILIPVDRLKLCAASQVPARCGYTAEQLADYGYE
jgi:hypothetical protein